MAFHVPEKFRFRGKGRMGSDAGHGNNGAFIVPNRIEGRRKTVPLRVIASDGAGWDHVSVSLPDRCPTWEEMDYIKRLFWDDEDAVMQLHPPRSQWVNNHPYCLHLWRPQAADIPLPWSGLVGVQFLGDVRQLDPGFRVALYDALQEALGAPAKDGP